MKVAITQAQASALECRGLDLGLDDDELLVARCWIGRALMFDEADREPLFSALVAEANAEGDVAEDRNAEPDARRFARGASRALGNLASKVLDAVES